MVPVLKNPFVFERPVSASDAACYWDSKELNSIATGLLHGQYYTILGPRLSGITSMVWAVLDRTSRQEPNCHCLYVDLQNQADAMDEQSLFRGILESVQWMPSGKILPPPEVADYPQFTDLLIGMVRNKPVHLVLALDHLDSEMLPLELTRSLVRRARVLYNERLTDPEYSKISVLIGGSQSPYALSTGSGSPFNIAERHWLRDFSAEEVEGLVQRGQQASGVWFEEEAIARLASATAGNKYFVQRICHACVEQAQESAGHKVTQEMVSSIIDRLVATNYGLDACFRLLVRNLKRDPDLTEVVTALLRGKDARTHEYQANIEQMRLYGVLEVENGKYRFRNEIYERFLHRRREMIQTGWAVHSQARKLVGLHHITLDIAAELGVTDSLNKIAWTILKASEMDCVAVYLLDETVDRFRREAVAATTASYNVGAWLEDDAAVRQVMDIQVPCNGKDWAFCDHCDLRREQCSCRWVPLTVEQDTLGVMVLAANDYHDFSNVQEVWIAEIIAAHLAIAVSRMKLLHTLQADMDSLKSLYEVSTKLRSSIGSQAVLQTITSSLANLFNLTTCTIGLLDASGEQLQFVAHLGLRGPTIRLVKDLPADMWHRIRYEGKPIEVNDVSKYPALVQVLERSDLRAFAAFPLQGKEEFLGILTMSSKKHMILTDRDWNLVNSLIEQAAVAIEAGHVLERLRLAYAEQDSFIKLLAHHWFGAPAFAKNALDLVLEGRLGAPHLNADQVRQLKAARAELTVYLRHLERLGELARLEGGKLIPVKRPVSLARIVQEGLELYASAIREKKLDVQSVVQTKGIVQADVGMIEVVMSSLIDNALKFSPEGGAIVVEIREQGDAVNIGIEDQGPGISPEAKERLGERFFQATPYQGGIGLGLHFARRFVEMHGGQLRFPDKEGPGCRVEVVLPFVADTDLVRTANS